MKAIYYILILSCPLFVQAQHFGFLHEVSSYSPPGFNEVQIPSTSAGLARNKVTGNLILTSGSMIMLVDQNNGTFISRFGDDENIYSYVTGITTDNLGNYYILQNNFILKYDPAGKYVSAWGGTGSGDGQLNNPTSICTDDVNDVYVTDAGNRRVQKFDSQGNFKIKFGTNGSGSGQFNYPQGIAYSPVSDQIVVGDYFNGNVQTFSKTGTFIATSSVLGSVNSIDIDPVNNTVLILTINYIFQLDPSLNQLSKWGSNGTGGVLNTINVASVVVSSISGFSRLFAVDKGRLITFFLGGATNGNLGASYGSSGTALGQFDKPAAADYSRTGSTLHVVDWGKIDPITQVTTATLNKGVTLKTTSAIAMKLPWTVMTDQNYQYILDNTLIPSPNHLNIYKFNLSDNSYVSTISLPIIGINSVTMDRNGNFYFAKQSGSLYIIYKFDNAGSLLTQWNTPVINSGMANMYLATDASNNVYASTSDDYPPTSQVTSILKYSSTGTLLNSFGSRGTTPGLMYTILSIDVDDSGKIYELEYNRVQVFDAAFNFLQQIDLPSGIEPGLFNNPFLLRVNAAGDEMAIIDNKDLNRAQYFKLKTDQSISFGALANKTDIDAPFSLVATGGPSGMPVTYKSSNAAVATVSGSIITIVGSGTTTITASQAGTGSYNAAPDVQQPLTVTSGKTSQVIQFNALPSVIYGSDPFQLSATGGESGNAITYSSSNTNVAIIVNNTVTIVGAGTVTITANQVGNATFIDAAPASQSLLVNKADQVITFNALPGKGINDIPFKLHASGGASGNVVTYVSSNTAVATIKGNEVTILSAGSTIITAHQEGNANFNPASDVPQPLTVSNLLSQSITFNLLADKTMGDGPFLLNGTTSSGLDIMYSTGDDEISITNANVTIVKPGHVTITANQNGNATFSKALSIVQSFCIHPATPLISASSGDAASPVLTSSSPTGNQWFLNGLEIVGATDKTYSVTAPGEYAVQVNAEACLSAKSQVREMIITGLEKENMAIQCVPNPATSAITIQGISSTDTHVIIYNIRGTPIAKGGAEYLNHEINVSDYAPGMYFICVITNNRTIVRKFIKQ